jgi:hypothetical protein
LFLVADVGDYVILTSDLL